MIYIKFLNACTVVYFHQLVKNKISSAANMLAIKSHTRGDVTHLPTVTLFVFQGPRRVGE
jgi:hypothetical protein